MAEIDTYDSSFPMENSICKNCANRMSRFVIPLDVEDFGISEEDLKNMNISDDDEIMVEQHTCLIAQEDMDYIVKECTHFRDKKDISLFSSNPYI